MKWPPINRLEFLDMQKAFGGDHLIAKAMRVSKRRVELRRRRFEVEPLTIKAPPPSAKTPTMPENEISRLFAGRRF